VVNLQNALMRVGTAGDPDLIAVFYHFSPKKLESPWN
jgi:hypothetical protein